MIDLRCGNNLDLLPTLADCSVDACVCDPPYELGFMGRKWDSSGIAYNVELWRQVLRVLKPGGHLVAFGGTRTYHRMTCAIEDAGFEIRDCLGWLYGSGFPKSLDVSKAIDKGNGENRARQLRFTAWMRSAGITAEQINHATGSNMASHYLTDKSQPAIATADMFDKMRPYLPKVPEEIERLVCERTGLEWTAYKLREVVGQQRGTMLAVAPGQGSDRSATTLDITAPATDAAKQWQGWGTALKPAWEPAVLARKPLDGTVAANVLAHGCGALNVDGCRISAETDTGRWPANILHDGSDQAEAVFPDDASRFFYSAKTAVWERETGLDDLPRKTAGELVSRTDGSAGMANPRTGAGRTSAGRANIHPTVKPVDLMRWLVRLVTPPGGTVLDPFAGSGSTGMAAMLEGFGFVGFELDPQHVEIARRRIDAARHRTIVVKDGKVAPADAPQNQQELPW